MKPFQVIGVKRFVKRFVEADETVYQADYRGCPIPSTAGETVYFGASQIRTEQETVSKSLLKRFETVSLQRREERSST